jgi:hypothetical protein
VTEADGVPEFVRKDALELNGTDEFKDIDALARGIPDILAFFKRTPRSLIELCYEDIERIDARVKDGDLVINGICESVE